MAINSYGYPDTIAPGSIMARFSDSGFGHRYSVLGFSDFRVTAATSGTRRVNIGDGWAMGRGVMVNNTAPTTYDLPAPAGTSQWMLVGLKRWDGAGPAYGSIITHVLGTTSYAVPTVTQTAGTDDTQWLALCRVTSTDALVQDVVDLRLVSTEGGGSYTCYSDLAMQQLDTTVGAQVYRADTGQHYKLVSSMVGTASWKDMKTEFDAWDVELTGLAATKDPAANWQRQSTSRLIRKGKQRWLHLVFERGGPSAPTLNSDARGSVGGAVGVASVLDADKPAAGQIVPLRGRLRTVAGNPYPAFGTISSTGVIALIGTAPDLTISYSSGGSAEIVLEGSWWM